MIFEVAALRSLFKFNIKKYLTNIFESVIIFSYTRRKGWLSARHPHYFATGGSSPQTRVRSIHIASLFDGSGSQHQSCRHIRVPFRTHTRCEWTICLVVTQEASDACGRKADASLTSSESGLSLRSGGGADTRLKLFELHERNLMALKPGIHEMVRCFVDFVRLFMVNAISAQNKSPSQKKIAKGIFGYCTCSTAI